MTIHNIIIKNWNINGQAIIESINHRHITPMSTGEFLHHCERSDNLCVKILSGIKALYPDIYALIPSDMTRYNYDCVNAVTMLLGVYSPVDYLV